MARTFFLYQEKKFKCVKIQQIIYPLMLGLMKYLTFTVGIGKKEEETLSYWDVEFLSDGGTVGHDSVSSVPAEAFVNFSIRPTCSQTA